MVVGEQGMDHKTTAIKVLYRLLQQAAPDRRVAHPGSAEGFVEQLAETPQQILIYEDLATLFMATKSRSGGNYMSQLKGYLLTAFDCDPISRRTKKAIDRVDEPRLSILGAVNRPILDQYTDPEDFGTGYMSRFMAIYARRERNIPLLRGVMPDVEEWLVDWMGRMANLATTEEAWGRCTGITHSAAKRLIAFDDAVAASRPALPFPERANGPLARARTHSLKIAMLLALSSGYGWATGPGTTPPDWVLTDAILKPALQIGLISMASGIVLASSSAATLDMVQRQQVLDTIGEEWTPEHLILRGGRVLKRKANEILNTLLHERRVEKRMNSLSSVEWRRVPEVANERGVQEAWGFFQHLTAKYAHFMQNGTPAILTAPPVPPISLPPLPGISPPPRSDGG